MTSEMVNGAVLHYEERGSGPPLLLVHGTGSYADIWSPVLDGLARSYRVIAYDRRGFARSSPAPGGALAEHARDAAALREMDQMIRPYPTRAAIRTIACPVTAIEGDLSDPAFATAGFVMRLLPQARFVSLPGAAHMLHIDQPEGWVEIVTQTTGHVPPPAAVPSRHPQ
jgi:pimeloyl-ACP methyl ester carboxylesterase